MRKIPVRHINSPQKLAAFQHFSIRRVEDLLHSEDLFHELHRHDFFFILALQKGSGVHEIDFTKYAVAGNSVFFLRPGQVHQLQLKAGASGYLMEFNAEFYHPLEKLAAARLRKASNRNFYAMQAGRFEKLQLVLSYILHEFTEQEQDSLDIIKANLDIFFIELLRQSRPMENTAAGNTPYAQERLEEFMELLETHITQHKQVAYYTKRMHLSAYQLNEITKATVGKTSSAIINDHIILEAKRQLLATTNQVKDIADQLGYEDASYFIRFFKKQTGYSPEAFRQHSA